MTSGILVSVSPFVAKARFASFQFGDPFQTSPAWSSPLTPSCSPTIALPAFQSSSSSAMKRKKNKSAGAVFEPSIVANEG